MDQNFTSSPIVSAPTSQFPVKKSNSKKLLVIVSLVVMALLLAVFAFFIFRKKVPSAQAVDILPSLIAEQAKIEKDYTYSNYPFLEPKIVVNPYQISPLTVLVIFKTEDPKPVTVTVKGKDALSTFTHTFPSTTDHRLPIYGLYPGQDNQVVIKVDNREKVLTIKTEPLPEDFAKIERITADKAELDNQLYFLSPASAGGKTMAVDVNGDVRWYLTKKLVWQVKRSANGRLLLSSDRLMKAPYYNTGLYELDLLGKIYTEYNLPGGYHHDYFERKNGNLLVATNEYDTVRQTVEDVIVEIDRQSGNIIKKIDLAQILPMDSGKSISWTAKDWFHNNSVWLDESRNELVLSGRHQDAVVILDYDTTRIKYIIGDPTGWSEEMQQYMLKPVGNGFEWQWEQHAAKVLTNGDLLLFDNGNNKTKNADKAVSIDKTYSRAVIYRINRADKTITQIWQYGKERGADYFSPYISEVDYLGVNHYLVHSGGVNTKAGVPTNKPAGLAQADTLRSFTTELKNGKLVFELVTNKNYYRAEKMSLYAKAEDNLQLITPRQIGKTNSSATCVDIPVHRAVNSLDKTEAETYQQYQITLRKEADRLAMSGKFDKKAVVRLALKNAQHQYTYSVPVDITSDTQALCVDIFNYNYETSGDIVQATTYINQIGVASGRYRIYISVNNKIYDTARYVEFW